MDGYYAMVNQKGQVQKQMCKNNGNPSIAKFHNILLAPGPCNGLFSIIVLINLGHTCLFHKVFSMVYFENKKENVVTLPNSAQRKHSFLVKTNEKAKWKKTAPRNKDALELLRHGLGHRYTTLLMAVYTANVCKGVELSIYPGPFCTSSLIYSMNQKSGSKNPLKPKAPFKWVLWMLF